MPRSNALRAPGPDVEAPWLQVARGEQGVRCSPPGQNNPRITAYHAGTNIAGYDDKAAWCSSFVHWCLAQVGIAGTGSALARSWLSWGEALDVPRARCWARSGWTRGCCTGRHSCRAANASGSR